LKLRSDKRQRSRKARRVLV